MMINKVNLLVKIIELIEKEKKESNNVNYNQDVVTGMETIRDLIACYRERTESETIINFNEGRI